MWFIADTSVNNKVQIVKYFRANYNSRVKSRGGIAFSCLPARETKVSEKASGILFGFAIALSCCGAQVLYLRWDLNLQKCWWRLDVYKTRR